MNKIIFLDFDGVLIPSSAYFMEKNFLRDDDSNTYSSMASYERWFSPTCFGLLKKLVEETGALIVTNTYHNNHNRKDNEGNLFNAKDDLILAGIGEEHFHPDSSTEYPQFYPENNRYTAINKWLSENGPANWIAFDDEPFLKEGEVDFPRLILCDFDYGITLKEFEKAREVLNHPEIIHDMYDWTI